jgi:hypothetical protein
MAMNSMAAYGAEDARADDLATANQLGLGEHGAVE